MRGVYRRVRLERGHLMNTLSKAARQLTRLDRLLAKPFLKIQNPQLRAAAMTAAITSVIWLIAALVIPLAPFGPNSLCTNDGYAQYMPFLSEFWSIFREGGSTLYSFHGALGSNFYLTMAYYLFSPFTFLCLLFDKAQIPAAANLIIILKNILISVIMAWYLASKGRRSMPFLASAAAIVYGFSFYFLGYAVNFMWMDSIALVPLMLYGMERIAAPKGRTIYLLSLAAAILMNFYMGAIICIFLALYYALIHLRFTKEGWKQFFWFAACSIAAVLVAGVVLIPVIRGMLMDNTSRMSPPDFEVFNDLKYVFSRLLPDADVIRITHNRGTVNLYMGTAVIFGSLLFVQNRQIPLRTRIGLCALCLLYLVSTQISWLNYAFHGFYMQRQVPNRYGFLIALLAAMMMYQGFLSVSNSPFRKTLIAGSAAACYFALISVWSDWGEWNHLWLALLLPGVVLLYLLAALKKKRTLIAWMLVLESVGGMAMLAPGSLDSSYTQMSKFIDAASLSAGGRAEILCSDIVNAPMLYGMNGVSAFNSVINPKTAGLLGKLGFASGENYYRFYGYTPLSALFLGVRNITTQADALMPYPFVETAQSEDLHLWTSPYETSLGFVLPDSAASMDSTDKFANLNVLYPDAFISLPVEAELSGDSESDTQNGQYTIRNIKSGDRNTLTLKPFTAESVYLYANAGGSRSFKVLKNGTTLADNKYEGNIVYLGDVKPEDSIVITFEADDDRSEQKIRLQAASLSEKHLDAAAKFYEEHGLKDQVVSSNVITGTYSNPDPQTMVFTVPYDAGWSAYVNGRSVPVSAWQNALVSIPLDAGDNTVRLVYQPVGLDQGLWVSALGVLLSAGLLLRPWFRKKRGSRQNPEEAQSAAKTSDDKQPAAVKAEDLPAAPSTVILDLDLQALPEHRTGSSQEESEASENPEKKDGLSVPRLSRMERRKQREAQSRQEALNTVVFRAETETQAAFPAAEDDPALRDSNEDRSDRLQNFRTADDRDLNESRTETASPDSSEPSDPKLVSAAGTDAETDRTGE